VANPEELVSRYLESDAVVIDKGEPRSLDFHAVSDPEDAIQLLRKQRRHKILWFCESRQDVEIVAERLTAVWPKNRIVAHHGSLSKRQREDAESAMREWPWGLCVATMTMEIGIDIGDVDAVVLHRPPRTISAFQQRIGRGCRRQNSMFAIGICDSPGDLDTYKGFVQMTRDGALESTTYVPDNSVAVQQLLSYLYGTTRGATLAELTHLLSPILSTEDCHDLVHHLEGLDEGPMIIRRGERLHATTRTMDLGEKGVIHSNIPSSGGKKFVDAASGKAIGHALGDLTVGDVVLLAGKSRRVTRITNTAVQLEPTRGGGTQAPRFSRERSSGAWKWLLPDTLRKRNDQSTK
jgi:ATP-dependent Lhr-like helicase